MTEACATDGQERVWRPSDGLSGRVRRLRQEYFAYDERSFSNEVLPFSTGEEWDEVWTPHNWTVVPEVIPFLPAFADSLAACARRVSFDPALYRLPIVERRARFFAEVIEHHLPVEILEGELVAGGRFNTALSLTLTRREAASYRRDEKIFLREALELDARGMGNCGAVPGHLIPDYPRVLQLGLGALVDEILARIEAEPRAHEANALRRALVRTAEAARVFSGRYADEATRLAASESNQIRKQELEEIASICLKVPWNPATTLHEAIQSLWFVHMLVMAAESYPGPGLSPGRIDQYLYPYYRDDLQAGRLTREQAKELFCCLWIKHNYAYDYQARIGDNQGINSSFGQLVTLGGIDARGRDASNELTWLLLEVIEEMNLLEPKPNVRLHRDTPPDLMRRVAAMCARAQGSPFLLNFDEHSIEGLAWQGLPENRLWDYAPVGCLENTLQGDDRSGTVDVNLNLAKAIELTMFDGRDLDSGKQLGPRTGDPVHFASWEEFERAFFRQLDGLVDRLLDTNDRADRVRARYAPTPFLSLLVGGCAESGRDVTAGGARHNFITVEGVGLATAVDSLLAVRSLVYQQGRLSMPELVRALGDDFEGHEKIRALLLNKAPKYGNDQDEADALAARLSSAWTSRVAKRVSPTGKRYRGGYLSWNYWVAYAPRTAATPDGRPRGTYLSNGTCPVTGRDRLGPTANARSVGKLGLHTAPNGDSHTITLSPSLVRDDEHIEKLAAFLRAYCDEGGTALQINILDPQTLLAARDNPEEYANLLVRVTGYNAYFVTLGREIQDEIIARISHQS